MDRPKQTDQRPTLCLDFDGVIHSYTSPWVDETTMPDAPVPGVLEWIAKALHHFHVVVYSTRSKSEAGREAMRQYISHWAYKLYGFNHPLAVYSLDKKYPIEFVAEKPSAFLTIDDRALLFNGDWDDCAYEPRELLKFRPWNKK